MFSNKKALVHSDVGHASEGLAKLRAKHRSLAVAAHHGLLFQRKNNEPRAQASGFRSFASTTSACPGHTS
jgi:hypothetical protein